MLFVLKQNCVWLYLQRLEFGKIIKLIYLNFLDWIIGNIPVWKKKSNIIPKNCLGQENLFVDFEWIWNTYQKRLVQFKVYWRFKRKTWDCRERPPWLWPGSDFQNSDNKSLDVISKMQTAKPTTDKEDTLKSKASSHHKRRPQQGRHDSQSCLSSLHCFILFQGPQAHTLPLSQIPYPCKCISGDGLISTKI